MANTNTTTQVTEEQHIRVAKGVARAAARRGDDIRELESRIRELACLDGHDWALSWPAAVDAYHDALN